MMIKINTNIISINSIFNVFDIVANRNYFYLFIIAKLIIKLKIKFI